MADSGRSLSIPTQYHRVYKEALDDCEVFTSVADMMEYCRNGPSYNGHRLSVHKTGGDLYSVKHNYVVRDGRPLLIPEGWEPVWKEFTSGMGMLVYYYNSTSLYDAKMGYSTMHFDTTKDPLFFSILESLGVFRNYSDEKLYFAAEITTKATSGDIATQTSLWSQAYDPIEEYSKISLTRGANGKAITLMRAGNYDNSAVGTSTTAVTLCPRTSSVSSSASTYIVRIYAISDHYYIQSMGGDVNG